MPKKQPQADPLYDTLLLLDRLEELREDMEELGITSLDELSLRIAEIEARLGDENGDWGDHGPV